MSTYVTQLIHAVYIHYLSYKTACLFISAWKLYGGPADVIIIVNIAFTPAAVPGKCMYTTYVTYKLLLCGHTAELNQPHVITLKGMIMRMPLAPLA